MSIRLWRATDDAGIRALDRRVQPYTDADEPEVQAMYERADAARRDGRCWVPLTADKGPEHHPFADDLAAWVATMPGDRLVGTVGLRRVGDPASSGPDTLERAMPGDWMRCHDGRVAEVRHLRVDPDVRRRGVASALPRTALCRARADGYSALVLNTTTPQSAARRLYEKEGFAEFAGSLLGRYELVWMSRRLGT